MKYTKSCALNIAACTWIISFSGNGGVRFRKRLKKFAKHRLGNFYGAVGFVILAVISIIVAQWPPPTKFTASHTTYFLFELI